LFYSKNSGFRFFSDCECKTVGQPAVHFFEEEILFKVALVGTHGVNKTTIAYELAGALKRAGRTVELLTETARECPFPLNEQATREAYQWIIARQIQLEIEKTPRADVLVCDRSVLDNFAYYVLRYGNGSSVFEALRAYCLAWMDTYDLLVRLPITHALEADGFRSTDEDFQRRIDQLCDELFETRFDALTHPAYTRGSFSAVQIAKMIFLKEQAAREEHEIEAVEKADEKT
jgi:nicotinamide riboside kinase